MNQEIEQTQPSKTVINLELFRNKKWLVIISCLIFAPVGIFILLASDVFSKKSKLILTVLFISFFISPFIISSKLKENRQARELGFSSVAEWEESYQTKKNLIIQQQNREAAENEQKLLAESARDAEEIKTSKELGYLNVFDWRHAQTLNPQMSSLEYYKIKEAQNEINRQAEEDRKFKYTIISDTHKRNIKRTVEVELSDRTDEKTLKEIAEKIFSMTDKEYERTFIAYRLKGDRNRSYWATTHFNPDLEVKIIGSTQSTHEALKTTPLPEGEIIGSWLVNWGGEGKLTAFKKDGRVYLSGLYFSSGQEFEMSQFNGKVKLEYEGGKERGEYFLINSEGNLEFWTEDRNYYTAPKI